MKELADFLAALQHNLQSEILECYQRFYTYTLELLEERHISFSTDTFYGEKKSIKKTIEKVFEITNLAFMTIGVPKIRLNEIISKLNVNYWEHLRNTPNYYKDFCKHLEGYIEFLLLEIFLEYIFDMDSIKIKNLYLFDLLPNNFIDNLDKFKQSYKLPNQIINVIKENLTDLISYINPSEFTIDTEKFRAIENLAYQPTNQPIIRYHHNNIPVKNEVLKHEIESLKVKPQKQKSDPSQSITITQQIPKTFLDDFGKFNPIKEEILKKFKIDKNNLINTKVINHDFYDLQNLFYFISILKSLNIAIPFKVDEIIQILQPYVKGGFFCSYLDGKPDPISNYYGLSILSEFNCLTSTELINISDIQMYLETELKHFIPEKLHLNFYTILCLKILEQSGGLMALKTHLITPILSLDIFSNNESINHVLDIFDHLAIIKLLDETINLNQFTFYIKKLKKLIAQNGDIHQSITDSARTLLIFDLLNLKESEINICENLFSFITESTSYFNSDNSNNYFDLKIDKIAITIELRMLFWALIAAAQYSKLV